MATSSSIGLDAIATCAAQLLYALAGMSVACHSPPESEPISSFSSAEPCSAALGHEVPGSSCDEREAAPCESGPELEWVAYSALGEVLQACDLIETVMQVELEDGCATRFVLSLEQPGGVECVSGRLAAVRYDCLAELACGKAVLSTLR